MFNFLKKEEPRTLVVDSPAGFKPEKGKQSVKEVIEEIHETFYTEVDRLLAEAKITKSTETQYKELIQKTDRLSKLGFSQTKEILVANQEIERLKQVKAENDKKADLIEAINYFALHYPTYKFITEESVKKICQKYNLVYSVISAYRGTVPDRALEEMEKFHIKQEDKCFVKINYSSRNTTSITMSYKDVCFEESQFQEAYKQWKASNHPEKYRSQPYRNDMVEAKLEITAPISDFDTRYMEVKDFKLQDKPAPDPVVLQPVMFKNVKHYLIVTAWGLEASDPLVMNAKLN